MRKSGIVFGLWALGLLVSAHASARELAVCVDVKVERAPSKPAASKPAASTPTTPIAEAPKPSDDSKETPSEPAAAAPPSVPPPVESTPNVQLGPRVNMDDTESVASVDPEGSRDPRVQSGAHLPLGQTPEAYLARLLQHYVTHERGYVAVKQGCEQRIVVELYPLRLGWTVFASYTGTGREERIDQLLPTELSQFAERSVLALLHDVAIGDTVDRNNVLWADSLKSTQSIHGRGHVIVGVGTRVRGGIFRTVNEAGDSVKPTLRLFWPVLLTVGYRGQFEEFGVEAAGEVDLGTSLVAVKRNPDGGHTDFGGSTGLTLHAMRYLNPRGLTSLYIGGGATFALHWFNVIKPESDQTTDRRSTLWSGGLDVDGIVGYEIMRASAVAFYLQGEINLPAYAVRNENDAGSINSWFPGVGLKLGTIF